jgi:hypothetical protein
MVASGLLVNQDATAGVPLSIADGLDTMIMNAFTWTSFGVQDFVSQTDSTIFGSLVEGVEFNSENFYLSSSTPIDGVNADTNYVLLGQLTTTGNLQFEMNLEIQYFLNGQWVSQQLMARDTLLEANQQFNPFLSYPFQCGCMDNQYLEYNSSFICSEEGACQTLAVIGCTDSLACNYNAAANIEYNDICCYPGFCGGRDILEVCPQLVEDVLDIQVYPNPSDDEVVLQAICNLRSDVVIEVYSPFGWRVYQQSLTQFQGMFNKRLMIEDWDPGVYYVVLKTKEDSRTATLVKI